MIKSNTYLGILSPVAEVIDIDTEDVKRVLASQTLIDALPTELTDQQRQTATSVIKSYEDILSQNEYDVGRTHLVEHAIDTGDHKPIRQALRRHPLAH